MTGDNSLTGSASATRADWESGTAAVLRKSRRLSDSDPDSLVWQKLSRTTLDGIDVAPIGSPEQVQELHTSGRPERVGPWDVRVAVRAGQTGANEDALAELNTGATSLWVTFADDSDVAGTLDGVLLDLAPVVAEGAWRGFATYLEGKNLHPGTNLGVDALADDVVEAAEAARTLETLAAVVDATTVHDRGASDAQEIGWSLAAGAAYLRTLADAGFSVAEAAKLVEFRYAATDEQFPTIAKLRAARRCWVRMLELSGVEAGTVTQRQHAVTSRPMMTKYDPYVNMLRGTVAAFAAGVAGAEAVTVIPFDVPFGDSNAFGRRIARNTSSLLIEESHVAAATDPAGGSYAVEKLTDDLAVAAWEELGRIEADGGVRAGADAFTERVAAVVAEREKQVATRRRPLTGLSEFPNLTETLPERDGEPDPKWAAAQRYGSSFEALRDEPAETPVFLATMGSIAQHTARATFASNLFAAGGVAVTAAGVTSAADDLVAAYDGQPVVCLAGTDAAYAEWGAAAIEALRSAGAKHVIIAGKATTADGQELSVDDSAAMGVDALAFLARTRSALKGEDL